MRKIYLASDSVARRKLLQILGVKFRILPSRISEQNKKLSLSYSGLVKKNALAKAKAAAAKVKSGVIVAADTIVVQDNRIFGKPKNLKSARKMLKKLSSSQQDIYTGVAVIDKPPHQLRKKGKLHNNWCGGKVLVACEKTRIFMDKLSDKEISEYFSRVSPLDKAGSFDIQGKGAFFIRRIEGCFYNVVGLPLRRLYRMFKEMHIRLFILFFFLLPSSFIFLNGCTTEYNLATKQEETYYYSYTTDKEVLMGQAVANQVEQQLKLADDPLIQHKVEAIGRKVAAVCDRKDIDYTFKVLEDDEVNAFSLPGGWIYVNKGLIDKAANDDEIAGVLGHEVGHIVARHSIKKLQAEQAFSILRLAGMAASQSSEAAVAADLAYTQIMMGYSREDELLADQLGTRYAKAAGYNPRAMLDFLVKLQDINRRRPLQGRSYYKTHPYIPDRMRVVKQELGEGMGFNDYINIEQLPHREGEGPNQ
ncbi:MAG: Maf and M48 domain-containing protein [Candidatus Omnitrophota bacterium]